MSPLWGFKIFVYRVCYKHVAPLGLKAPMHQNSRWTSIVGAGLPRPTGWGTQPLRIQRWGPVIRFIRAIRLICRIGDSDKEDMSPLWGLMIFACRVFYKHVAPLGLKAESNSPVTDMSAIVGAGLPCPMGWGTQPLRIQPSRFPLYPCNPFNLPNR